MRRHLSTGDELVPRRRDRLRRALAVVCAVVTAGVVCDGVTTSGAQSTGREFRGYYVFGGYSAQLAEDVADPLVAGIGSVLSWKDLAPSYGAYRWEKVDQLLHAVDAVGKNLILRVKVGRNSTADPASDATPSWLYTPHGGMPPAETYVDGDGYFPLFWDRTFQRDWEQFVTAMGQRYGSRTNIIVMVGGPWRAHSENWLPSCSSAEQEQWVTKYRAHTGNAVATWQDVRNAYDAFTVDWLYPVYATAFTGSQPLAAAMGLGLCDRDVSRPVGDPLRHPRAHHQLTTARQRYGGFSGGDARGFFVQSNSLRGWPNETVTWVGNVLNPVDGVSDRGVIGYQAIGGTEPFCNSNQCVPNEDFDEMLSVAVSQGASYVEIYRPDVHAAIHYAEYPVGSAMRQAAEHIRAVLLANKEQLRSTLPPQPAPQDEVFRVSGTDRLATALEASRSGFSAGAAGAVVLARHDAFPDALAGVPLAHAKNGPLLLTTPGELPPAVQDELRRVLSPGRPVYLLGGVAAVSAAVEETVRALQYSPVRFMGADRFETATAIAEGGLGNPNVVVLASGTDFADALSAGPAATTVQGAVLLTAGATLAPATAAYLSAHPASQRFALGGPAARADPSATAIVGEDRYDTSTRAAAAFFRSPTTVGVASGATFPDALAGGAHISKAGGPLLLSAPDALPGAINRFLVENRSSLSSAYLYGGPVALTDTVLSQVEAAIRQPSTGL